VLAISRQFSHERALTFIALFPPVLIIGTLFFISFKKGLIEKEVSDANKIIYKTRRRVIWGLLSIGFLIGATLVALYTGTLYNMDTEALREKIKSQQSKIDEQRETIEKAMKPTNGKGRDLYYLIAPEWEQAKILSLLPYARYAEIQQADRKVIGIDVGIARFFKEVKVGDISWLNREERTLKTKSESVYSYRYN
jgi:hypothetical protein